MTNELAQVQSPQMLMPVAQPSQAIEAHKAAVAFINETLEQGKDYGKIPGTDDKMNLLKPGAERLAGGYGLRPEYIVTVSEADHNHPNTFELTKWVKKQKPDKATEAAMKEAKTGRNKKVGDSWVWQESEIEKGVSYGLYRYVITCRLYRGDMCVGEGIGSCSSVETKYIRQPRDYENTIIKMAKKRAFVDAVLTTLGLSDRFTQDAEDIQANKATVDDSVPAAEYVEDVPAVDPSLELAKEAGAWFKSIGFTKENLAEFKEQCGDKQWFDVALNLKKLGAASVDDVFNSFVTDPFADDVAVDAEIVEEAPKGKGGK